MTTRRLCIPIWCWQLSSETRSFDLGGKQGRRWQFNKETFLVHPEPLLYSDAQDAAGSASRHRTAPDAVGPPPRNPCRALGAAPPGQWPETTLASLSLRVPACRRNTHGQRCVQLYVQSSHCNESCTQQYAVGEISADPCPVPQKASTSSSSHPPLLGLAPGTFRRINFTYRCILLYIDFSYESKLRIKLAKTDLLTLLNEARVD